MWFCKVRIRKSVLSALLCAPVLVAADAANPNEHPSVTSQIVPNQQLTNTKACSERDCVQSEIKNRIYTQLLDNLRGYYAEMPSSLRNEILKFYTAGHFSAKLAKELDELKTVQNRNVSANK